MKGWTYTFSATKDHTGQLVIISQGYFNRALSAVQPGEVFDLTIAEHQEKRTGRQLRGLWGPVYTSIVEFLLTEQGYRRDEWPRMKELIHEGLCGQYQGFVTCPITKKDVRKFRLSTATKQETTEFMSWVAQYMAEEHGFVVQMPGEAA